MYLLSIASSGIQISSLNVPDAQFLLS